MSGGGETEVELNAEEDVELDAALDEAERDGGGLIAHEFLRVVRMKYGRG